MHGTVMTIIFHQIIIPQLTDKNQIKYKNNLNYNKKTNSLEESILLIFVAEQIPHDWIFPSL